MILILFPPFHASVTMSTMWRGHSFNESSAVLLPLILTEWPRLAGTQAPYLRGERKTAEKILRNGCWLFLTFSLVQERLGHRPSSLCRGGQAMAPWGSPSSCWPTASRWTSPRWTSTSMRWTSSLRSAHGGSTGMWPEPLNDPPPHHPGPLQHLDSDLGDVDV